MKFRDSKARRRKFYLAWLVMGIIQVAALSALEGCGSDSSMAAALKSGDSLLSNTEPQAQAAEQPAPILPLRVSRAFFEGPLHATLVVGAPSSSNPRTFESAVSWDNQPTTLPPPDPSQGTVLADFRDTVGCAVLSDLENTGLCFDVMPDVSDVGINDREMRLQGAPEAGCSASQPAPTSSGSSANANTNDIASEILPPSAYHLVSAQKTDTSLVLEFAPVQQQAQACGTSTVRLTLRKM